MSVIPDKCLEVFWCMFASYRMDKTELGEPEHSKIIENGGTHEVFQIIICNLILKNWINIK